MSNVGLRTKKMIQFLADNLDQLDLALDQLAVRDRNYDRFALMLVDNVVELTLHQFGQEKASENKMWSNHEKMCHDPKVVSMAIGQYFDDKVKGAFKLGLLNELQRDSLLILHTFRNTSYHQGLRHESILHSLALFYFEIACDVLKGFEPRGWTWGSKNRISYRAKKYMESDYHWNDPKAFNNVYDRLKDIVTSMKGNLIEDLSNDIDSVISEVDGYIDFLATDSPEKKTRDEVIIDAQAWPFAFTDEAKLFALENNCPEQFVGTFVDWIGKNYPWPIKSDPVPKWRKRHQSISEEKDKHTALKKYWDFLQQTEEIRSKIEGSAAQLDAHIQHLIDVARGK